MAEYQAEKPSRQEFSQSAIKNRPFAIGPKKLRYDFGMKNFGDSRRRPSET